jgi:SAM-dependent methyltransferase
MGPPTTRRAAEALRSAEAFKELERAGWAERAETYGLLTGRITARLVEPLLDAAGVAAGTRLLDVGTGPGYAAEQATRRGAFATGVDIADELVALARRRHPGIRFLRADAEDLPFAERSFDALVSNFTINHLPRPEQAIREFARVVAPRGGIALSAWDRPERNRFLGILVDALRASGVTRPPEASAGPDPYRFADDNELRGLLHIAGLESVEIRSVSLTHRVADADALWEGMLGGSVRTAGMVVRQPPRVRTRIRAAAERLAEEYRVDGGLAIPACAKIARGRKP